MKSTFYVSPLFSPTSKNSYDNMKNNLFND